MSSAKSFLFLCFALFAICANARHVRDAPQTHETEISFTNLLEKVQTGFETLKVEVRKSLGAKNDEELKEKALTHARTIAGKFDEIKDDVVKQTENFKDSEAVKQLRQTLESAIGDLKSKNPETAKDLENVVEKAQKGSETILNKLSEFKDSDEARQLQSLGDQFVQALVKVGKEIGNELQESLKTKN